MTVRDSVGGCFWVLFHKLCIKLCFVGMRPGIAMGIRFHQEEPIKEEWAARGQPTCSVLGL